MSRSATITLVISTLMFVFLAEREVVTWWISLFGWIITLGAAWYFFQTSSDVNQPAPFVMPATIDKSLVSNFIEALPDACLFLNKEKNVCSFNRKAAELIPQLAENTPLSFYLRWPDLNIAVSSAQSDNKVSSVDIEEKVPIERWYTIHVAPVELDNNKFICLTIHDLTQEKRAERMRVDFVANASHELRTPLASLVGFIETLQGAARNDELSRDKFLSIMQRQAQRMSRLIDDLLSLSRIERHAHIRPDTPLDLTSLVQSIIDGLKPLAADRGVELMLRAPQMPLSIMGDRDELVRAFENLIENAIKYGSDGKKVEIEILSGEDNESGIIRIDIRDYGPGIAEEHISRLTERFYRVDEASSREKGGTGLGLAIVKHILTRHQGHLEIKSKLGQGSVFTAFFPRLR